MRTGKEKSWFYIKQTCLCIQKIFILNQKSQAIVQKPSRTRHFCSPQFTVIVLITLLGSQLEIQLRVSFTQHDQVKAAGGQSRESNRSAALLYSSPLTRKNTKHFTGNCLLLLTIWNASGLQPHIMLGSAGEFLLYSHVSIPPLTTE